MPATFHRLGGFSGGASLVEPPLPASSLTRNTRTRSASCISTCISIVLWIHPRALPGYAIEASPGIAPGPCSAPLAVPFSGLWARSASALIGVCSLFTLQVTTRKRTWTVTRLDFRRPRLARALARRSLTKNERFAIVRNAHSLRAEVKALNDEISLMRQHSDSPVSGSAGHLIEGRSVADWATHARELEYGMSGLVAKAEEASQKNGRQREALMQSLHASKRAELEAVSKWRALEEELLTSQLTVRRYEDRSLPLPPQAGSDESVIEVAGNVGEGKPAAAPTLSTSTSSDPPAVVPSPVSATNVFVAALQAKMDAVVGAGEDSSNDSFGLCVDANRTARIRIAKAISKTMNHPSTVYMTVAGVNASCTFSQRARALRCMLV